MSNCIVIKCGGSSIDELSAQFFHNIKALKKVGIQPIIVHGGGPAIKEMLNKLKIEFEFIDGLRKTTEEMMDIVEMVLTGNVNPALTRRVHEYGIDALGVANVLKATPIDVEKYGYVGDVTDVHVETIERLLHFNIVPVVSPVAIGEDGKTYNVNADTAAAAVAAKMNAQQLIFVTDVPGILKDDKLLNKVTEEEINALIDDGTIYGGMIPKVKAALASLTIVDEAMIVSGIDSQLEDETSLKGTTIIASTRADMNV